MYSCERRVILVTGNRFLSKEINSSQKNLFSLVKLALSSPCGIDWILPKILPELLPFVGIWFPGSLWICHPAPDTLKAHSRRHPPTIQTFPETQTKAFLLLAPWYNQNWPSARFQAKLKSQVGPECGNQYNSWCLLDEHNINHPDLVFTWSLVWQFSILSIIGQILEMSFALFDCTREFFTSISGNLTSHSN